ncbi:MAG: transcriptional regulator [Gammaproteobacteria bacterium SG8_47]|nr:MAG: transcriptional regulator [Gammaproteobacteria bacterium SG8_47]
MNNERGVLEFPCEFPIKVMGRTSNEFEGLVLSLVGRHVESLDNNAVTSRPSREGHYTALTITITATSREQLDAIYRELSACEHVLMAL